MDTNFAANNELHTQIQYRLIEQLSESERRYRELVENLREIVFKCDRNGHFTLLNKAWTATLGYETADCLNRPMDDFLHAEDREIWLSLLTQLKTDQEIECKELRFHHCTAEIIWLELSARSENQGEISGSLTNISDRKRAQAALREANEALQLRIEQLRRENLERRQAEATLIQSRAQLEQQTQQLEATLTELKQTQTRLVHAEKMSSLGQLVAGIAHEINNPINFIYGNVTHANEYIQDLLNLVALYRQYHPQPHPAIQEEIDQIDLDFLLQDLPKLTNSLQVGADRIRQIVLSLRNFSRLDEAEVKEVDLHEGIDSTLMILQSRLKAKENRPAIQVIKEYGALPLIECYAGQLNQVFMNLISNAIDALEAKVNLWQSSNLVLGAQLPDLQIQIRTEAVEENSISIWIIDNGTGMPEAVRARIFEPFFTTKSVGRGTGLGLSISYQMIVEKHRGSLECSSAVGEGTKFLIQIPVSLSQAKS
ncbi:ATP-binding protein [Leptodesmis sichuanensis]|uniref:ATP-binding protein n=1 Tax=Leptodesmis sichuanensis TaxID=2906798 RepID=UPI001F2D27AF|nr:ATP-binding protein [Leptodesmis sichuanensis]UIE38073.1 PAS domain S-box protein [Leptodesmis sichuanensis A121]